VTEKPYEGIFWETFRDFASFARGRDD